MNRCVFFDLDGTLVRAFPEGDTTRGPRTVEEVEFLPGTEEACQLLRDAGFLLDVVTNQPGIARGTVDPVAHREIRQLVTGTLRCSVHVCPHDSDQGCACRKPRPGLIYAAAIDGNIDLSQSWLIGDRETDIQAARAAGIPNTARVQPNEGILRAARWILSHGGLHGTE